MPPGDVRTILGLAGNATVCEPRGVEAMRSDIAGRLAGWRVGASEASPDAAVLELFAYRTIGARLAAVFDAVIDGREIDPGPLAEGWVS